MAISKEDVLEYISNLSVLELSELVKEFEEKIWCVCCSCNGSWWCCSWWCCSCC